MSNDILIGLTDSGKTWVTKYYKLIILLNKFFMKNASEIMFRWRLTYEAVPGEVRIPSWRGSIPDLSMRKVGIGTKLESVTFPAQSWHR